MNTSSSSANAGTKELESGNLQLSEAIRGTAPEIASPRAVPVCHEVSIRPDLISFRLRMQKGATYHAVMLEKPQMLDEG